MNDELLKDWRGVAITVGATILYAVKHSTSIEIVEGTVLAVDQITDWRGTRMSLRVQPTRSTSRYRSDANRPVHLTNLDKVTVLKA